MNQHAIPQQISSYEFKLVGEMTLKQFAKAAAGIILAMLINSTKLIFFIKWPLIAIFAGGGLAFAFVPFQDRPLEVWIGAFLKSIYSPTIFLYKKRANQNWLEIDMVKAKADEQESQIKDQTPTAVKSGEKIKEFIQSLPSVKKETILEEEVSIKKTTEVLDKKGEETVAEVIEVKEEEKVEKKEDMSPKLGLKTEKLGATGQAVFGAIPMPDIPDLPNLIVGMVTDNQGKIIEGAIVEVQDSLGNPARVLKTNPLGQFKSSTQLTGGKYLIITEKEGFDFDRVSLDLTGQLVKPIKILAK